MQAHHQQLSEFERGRIIVLKEAAWAKRRINRHMGQSVRLLEDAGKIEWTNTGCHVMMVVVELGPQQIKRID
ncbi:hypothetical protein TNCV_3823561 [Trichonephila clavipes]|nr:hypothetical protein TNCV_3823561 [Trichonephila clavipes]